MSFWSMITIYVMLFFVVFFLCVFSPYFYRKYNHCLDELQDRYRFVSKCNFVIKRKIVRKLLTINDRSSLQPLLYENNILREGLPFIDDGMRSMYRESAIINFLKDNKLKVKNLNIYQLCTLFVISYRVNFIDEYSGNRNLYDDYNLGRRTYNYNTFIVEAFCRLANSVYYLSGNDMARTADILNRIDYECAINNRLVNILDLYQFCVEDRKDRINNVNIGDEIIVVDKKSSRPIVKPATKKDVLLLKLCQHLDVYGTYYRLKTNNINNAYNVFTVKDHIKYSECKNMNEALGISLYEKYIRMFPRNFIYRILSIFFARRDVVPDTVDMNDDLLCDISIYSYAVEAIEDGIYRDDIKHYAEVKQEILEPVIDDVRAEV